MSAMLYTNCTSVCSSGSSTTTKPERMAEQIKPFLSDSSLPPLSDQHLTEIAAAGAAGPYRHWGVNWPYFASTVAVVSVPLV
jgi:hypothetical protein